MDLKSGPDPPCPTTHTHTPPPTSHLVWLVLAILLILPDFTQVCQFRWMRREGTDVYWAPAMIHVLWWCRMKSCHREVEVSTKSNQTKAKVVRCQHSEAPFQREFPVFLRSVCLFFFFFNWLHWVFIAALGLSRVAANSGGQLFILVCGLLTAVASLVVQHGPRGVGSVVVYKSFHLPTPTSHSIHFPNPLIKCIYLWESSATLLCLIIKYIAVLLKMN